MRDSGAPEFLSVSLRTDVLGDAVKRSADLLAALEAGEREMTLELTNTSVSTWRTKAMIREMVRSGMARMVARLEAPLDEREGKDYLAELERQQSRVRTAQRARDWTVAAEPGTTAAGLTGMQQNALTDPLLARELLAEARSPIEIFLRVEQDCDDPLNVGPSLLEDVGLKSERASLNTPMPLSEAIEKACAEALPDMETNIRAVGTLAITFFDDVPVATLSRDQVFDFLEFVWNMPKTWGQLHGKKRYEKAGAGLDPRRIQRDADAEDSALLAAVLVDSSLSAGPERRLRLVQELQPRLTDG